MPVLRRPEAAADPALFAEALVAAADLTCFSDVTTSMQLAHQAYQIARELGDNRLLVLTGCTLTQSCTQTGECERARPLGRQSVQRARELGDDVLLGMSLLAYGSCDATASGALYAEAIACTERSGDLFTRLAVLNNAGDICLLTGTSPLPGRIWTPRCGPLRQSACCI